MENPKFRVAIKSPHWDDYPSDKWLVSTNSFTIGEFWDHDVELEFKGGGSLPFGDIDWATDTVEYLLFLNRKDKNGVEIYNSDVVKWQYGVSINDETGEQTPLYGNKEVRWNDLGFLDDAEVVGNKYEHDHLLENENKAGNGLSFNGDKELID